MSFHQENYNKAVEGHKRICDLLNSLEMKKSEKKVEGFLRNSLNYQESDFINAFGDLGKKIHSFIHEIDFEHHDLTDENSQIYENVFSATSTIAKNLEDCIKLSKIAFDNGLSEIYSILSKYGFKDYIQLPSFKRIDAPSKNGQYIRIIKSSDKRWESRNLKEIKSVDLSSFYRKNPQWGTVLQNFNIYTKGNNAYEEEIVKSSKMMLRYKELRCNQMVESLQLYLENFKNQIQDHYYGFYKLGMTNAAVILAKLHGWGISYSPSPIKNTIQHITVKTQYFDGYIFEPVKKAKSDASAVSNVGWYFYSPRAYPWSKLSDLAGMETKSFINKLEEYPEIGGKPIFDHYIVMVPGVQLPERPSGANYVISEKDGSTNTFSNRNEAEHILDRIFIKNKYIVPIILGEKDGKCYFLSYFV